MVELEGVADADSLGGGIYNFVAAAVVDIRANAEPVMGAELPWLACSGFVVYGEFSADWSERCGVVVDGTVVVFPR